MLEGATRKHTAKLNINLAKGYGLDELTFSVNGDTELEGEYKLSEMTEEQRTAFVKKGIVLPVIGDLNPAIDFSAATATATANEDGSDATLALSNVVATAYTRSNDALSYKLITTKIDPDLVVYPGNIWTKEFTPTPVCASGNESLFNKNVSFEYSKDGGNSWIASPKNEAITGLNPGETYKVRSVCLGLVSDAKEVKTYPQIALENGGLEGAYISKGNDNKLAVDFGSLYVWPSWATVNELTCENAKGAARSFNSRSGSRPSSEIPKVSTGEKSVWISTIGYGYGSKTYKKVSPGELFLGTYNIKGIDFCSHPTGLNFYYKYAPFKGDKSDIYIQVLNDETVLGEGTLQEVETISEYKNFTINIVYNSQNIELIPNKLIVVFKSGFNKEVEQRGEAGLFIKYENPAFRGSELYIDDISLIYDK